MRNLIVPAVLIAALSLGTTAFAAPTSAPSAPSAVSNQQVSPPPSYAQRSSAQSATNTSKAKHAACEKSWKNEKHHTGTQKAFMEACVAKG